MLELCAEGLSLYFLHVTSKLHMMLSCAWGQHAHFLASGLVLIEIIQLFFSLSNFKRLYSLSSFGFQNFNRQLLIYLLKLDWPDALSENRVKWSPKENVSSLLSPPSSDFWNDELQIHELQQMMKCFTYSNASVGLLEQCIKTLTRKAHYLFSHRLNLPASAFSIDAWNKPAGWCNCLSRL